MKIDSVEKVWEDLEGTYKKSGAKSRRTFAEHLVSFNGQKGTVKAFEAMLKSDLDNSADAITRYSNICVLLDAAEEWLLKNNSEIADLESWLDTLVQGTQLDMAKLGTSYTGDSASVMLNNIKLGYVFPGLYGKSEEMSVDTTDIPGYVFLHSTADLNKKLPMILERAKSADNDFDRQVAYVLLQQLNAKELNFPCVFVDHSLLRANIYNYRRSKTFSETDVPILPNSETRINVNCDYGQVKISVITNYDVYVVRRA